MNEIAKFVEKLNCFAKMECDCLFGYVILFDAFILHTALKLDRFLGRTSLGRVAATYSICCPAAVS